MSARSLRHQGNLSEGRYLNKKVDATMNVSRWLRTGAAAVLFPGILSIVQLIAIQIVLIRLRVPSPGEERVRFSKGDAGTTITGMTTQTGQRVNFSSFQTLTVPTTDPDRITAGHGGNQLVALLISLAGSGTFTNIIANAFVAGDLLPGATLMITVQSSVGAQRLSLPLSRGDNIFALAADPGVTLSSVSLNGNVSDGVMTSFTDLRQVGLSGTTAYTD